MKTFDYYIFIDYSENLLGYVIIENSKVDELIIKLNRFRHFRETRDKKLYLRNIKKTINREDITKYFFRFKIRKVFDCPEIYTDIVVFIKKYMNCIIFISVDDKQYSNFERFVKIVNGESTKVVRESQLKKESKEYKMSLILDNLLNIERLKC